MINLPENHDNGEIPRFVSRGLYGGRIGAALFCWKFFSLGFEIKAIKKENSQLELHSTIDVKIVIELSLGQKRKAYVSLGSFATNLAVILTATLQGAIQLPPYIGLILC